MNKAFKPRKKKFSKTKEIDYLKNFVNNEFEANNYSVAVDWLSVYFTDIENELNREWKENEAVKLSEDVVLIYNRDKKAGSDFKHLIEVHYKNEVVANFLVQPFRESWEKKQIIKLEFKNHTFYSGICWVLYDSLIKLLKIEYRNTARLDIAIDGVNYLHGLFNEYAKQKKTTQIMQLKNSGIDRARFNCKVMNPKNFLFENFSIGGATSRKMITIYNKTVELHKSNKKYIFEYWAKNKLIEKVPENFEQQSAEVAKQTKKGKDIFNIPNCDNIYRFEMRLKSEAVQEIENFDFMKLRDIKYLVSIVKLHCRNFFELKLLTHKKLIDCETLQLLPFEQLGFDFLEKTKRAEQDDTYKAKVSIHKTVKSIYNGKIKNESINEYIHTIVNDTAQFEIRKYVLNKLLEWKDKYKIFVKKDRKEDVEYILNELKYQIESIPASEDFTQYKRVQNARATARFGEGKPL